MADVTPVFQIQRMYLKDLSLEQPNSPQVLLEQGQPQVEINLTLGAETISEAMYEVTVTATVTTRINDKTLFLVEASQAGIFTIRGVPADQLQPVLAINCPTILFPYVREVLADAVTRAGFPPVHLAPINFDGLYQQQLAQMQPPAGAVAN